MSDPGGESSFDIFVDIATQFVGTHHEAVLEIDVDKSWNNEIALGVDFFCFYCRTSESMADSNDFAIGYEDVGVAL